MVLGILGGIWRVDVSLCMFRWCGVDVRGLVGLNRAPDCLLGTAFRFKRRSNTDWCPAAAAKWMG